MPKTLKTIEKEKALNGVEGVPSQTLEFADMLATKTPYIRYFKTWHKHESLDCVLQGEFNKAGQRDGRVVAVWFNSHIEIGEFKNDQRDGVFLEFDRSGIKY